MSAWARVDLERKLYELRLKRGVKPPPMEAEIASQSSLSGSVPPAAQDYPSREAANANPFVSDRWLERPTTDGLYHDRGNPAYLRLTPYYRR